MVTKRLRLKDAANRAKRSLLQSTVLLVAIGGAYEFVLVEIMGHNFDPKVLVIGAGIAALKAAMAYTHRRWIDQLPVPSATPPTDTTVAEPKAPPPV